MTKEMRIIGNPEIAKLVATKADIKALEDKNTELVDKISELTAELEEKYIKKEDLTKIVEKTVADTLRPLMKSK